MNRIRNKPKKDYRKNTDLSNWIFSGVSFSFSLSSWFLYLNAGSVTVVKEESLAVDNFVPEEQEYQFWEMFPANEVEVERFKAQDKNLQAEKKSGKFKLDRFTSMTTRTRSEAL